MLSLVPTQLQLVYKPNRPTGICIHKVRFRSSSVLAVYALMKNGIATCRFAQQQTWLKTPQEHKGYPADFEQIPTDPTKALRA